MRARTLPGRFPARLPRGLVATAAGLVLAGALGPVDVAAAGPVEAAAEGPDGVQVVEVAVHETRTGDPETTYVLQAADGDLSPLDDRRGERLLEAQEQDETEVAAAAPAAHRAYVAVLADQGTLDTATTVLESRIDGVLDWWEAQSDGTIPAFDRVGPTKTFTSTASCSDARQASRLWNDAAAQFPGVTFSATSGGNHLVVLVPDDTTDCLFGLGTVGTGLGAGGKIIVQDHPALVEALAHEIGHNVSLEHARGEKCASACTVTEYDNAYDVMGYSGTRQPPSLSSSERTQLALATVEEVPTLALPAGQAGSVTTLALSARGSLGGVRGLRVVDPASGRTLYVDWRDGAGRDAGTRYATASRSQADSFAPGVVVERLQGDGVAADLLSRVLGTRTHRSLLTGETLTTGAVTVRVDAVGPVTAQVTVTLGTVPTTAPPLEVPVPVTTPTTTTTPKTSDTSVHADRPRLVGTGRPGSTLRARSTYSPNAAAVSWSWFVDGKRVKGAHRPSLELRRSWVGDRVTVQVTVSDQGDVDRARSRSVRVRTR